MSSKSDKIKSIVKDTVREKPKFGVDPKDPWSAKAGINEDELLNRYMQTKGLNPKTASKISKISASKTGEFEKWKRDHVSGGRLPVVKKEEIDKGLSDVKGSINATAKRHKQLKARQSMHNVVTTPGLKREDVYQDPQAATQTVFDGANNTNDVSEKLSRAAKLIKSIFKKKVNEDLYDHEKEDKSVATYGKKPKIETADKKDSVGENKPHAAAVMTGGSTLTGQKRDTIEIDPMMRNRPGQPDITKGKDKDKDKKKEENKKDK